MTRKGKKEDFTLGGLKLLIDGNHTEIAELRERYAVSKTNEDRANDNEREARQLVIEWQEKYAALMERERQERHDLRDKWELDSRRNQLEVIQRMQQIAALEKTVTTMRAEQLVERTKCERDLAELRAKVSHALEKVAALEATRPQPAESVPGESDPPSGPVIPLDGC